MCDWTEHTAPDGKKYFYNQKSGESVWEEPKELIEFKRRQAAMGPGGGPPGGAPPTTMPSLSAPPTTVSKDPEPKSDAPPASKMPAISKPAVSAQPTTAASAAEKAAKSGDKSRPVSSTPVHGTPWCVVWTGDNRVFFYNPSTKTSVWERPPDLIGRADVTEMLKSPASAEKMKAKNVPPGFNANPMGSKKKPAPDSDGDEPVNSTTAPPVAKKKKVELVFEDELKAKEEGNANGSSSMKVISKFLAFNRA